LRVDAPPRFTGLQLGSRGLQAISVLHATIAAGLIAGAGLFIFPWREKT
jgi:hypothetical protein